MDRALWLLVGLQLRGWLRFLGQNLRTVRGALLALVGVGRVRPLAADGPVRADGHRHRGVQVVRFGPGALLLYCVLNVVFSSHERAIYFSPAEVQFLFTGPFSRRQVLGLQDLPDPARQRARLGAHVGGHPRPPRLVAGRPARLGAGDDLHAALQHGPGPGRQRRRRAPLQPGPLGRRPGRGRSPSASCSSSSAGYTSPEALSGLARRVAELGRLARRHLARSSRSST